MWLPKLVKRTHAIFPITHKPQIANVLISISGCLAAIFNEEPRIRRVLELNRTQLGGLEMVSHLLPAGKTVDGDLDCLLSRRTRQGRREANGTNEGVGGETINVGDVDSNRVAALLNRGVSNRIFGRKGRNKRAGTTGVGGDVERGIARAVEVDHIGAVGNVHSLEIGLDTLAGVKVGARSRGGKGEAGSSGEGHEEGC